MKKKYPIKTVYYKSFSEDFDGGDMQARPIGRDYKYVREGRLDSFLRFVHYRLFATPLAFFYRLFVGREKFVGKEKLAAVGNRGFFLYCNHTKTAADAFIPNLAVFPRRGYTVVSSKNFSVPVFGRSLHYYGALPVPTELSALRNFKSAIGRRIEEGGAVIIYPEGHLWPYATALRPFGDESFTYPVSLGAPSFAFTRVYRACGRGFRSEIYIDGPFYPTEGLSVPEARAHLASRIRAAMEERCALSDIEIIRYVKKEEEV